MKKVGVKNHWSSTACFAIAPASTSFNATSRLPDAVATLPAGLELSTIRKLAGRLACDASPAPGYTSQAMMGRLTYPF